MWQWRPHQPTLYPLVKAPPPVFSVNAGQVFSFWPVSVFSLFYHSVFYKPLRLSLGYRPVTVATGLALWSAQPRSHVTSYLSCDWMWLFVYWLKLGVPTVSLFTCSHTPLLSLCPLSSSSLSLSKHRDCVRSVQHCSRCMEPRLITLLWLSAFKENNCVIFTQQSISARTLSSHSLVTLWCRWSAASCYCINGRRWPQI